MGYVHFEITYQVFIWQIITVAKLQSWRSNKNNVMVRVTTTRGSVLKGHNVWKVQNHCHHNCMPEALCTTCRQLQTPYQQLFALCMTLGSGFYECFKFQEPSETCWVLFTSWILEPSWASLQDRIFHFGGQCYPTFYSCIWLLYYFFPPLLQCFLSFEDYAYAYTIV